jgi:hypothetical protein
VLTLSSGLQLQSPGEGVEIHTTSWAGECNGQGGGDNRVARITREVPFYPEGTSARCGEFVMLDCTCTDLAHHEMSLIDAPLLLEWSCALRDTSHVIHQHIVQQMND